MTFLKMKQKMQLIIVPYTEYIGICRELKLYEVLLKLFSKQSSCFCCKVLTLQVEYTKREIFLKLHWRCTQMILHQSHQVEVTHPSHILCMFQTCQIHLFPLLSTKNQILLWKQKSCLPLWTLLMLYLEVTDGFYCCVQICHKYASFANQSLSLKWSASFDLFFRKTNHRAGFCLQTAK